MKKGGKVKSKKKTWLIEGFNNCPQFSLIPSLPLKNKVLFLHISLIQIQLFQY